MDIVDKKKPALTTIMLGSERLVGKDTFFKLLHEIDPRFVRFAFADSIKEHTENLCKLFFKKSISQLSAEEKEVFRPIMLSVGSVGRAVDINFWVKETVSKINHAEDVAKYLSRFEAAGPEAIILPVVTDLRFASEFAYFEIANTPSSVCVVNIQRSGAPEPTDDEKKYAPAIKERANYHVFWATAENNLDEIKWHVEDFYKWLQKNYEF